MNIFILNAGRCGSLTFIAACRHITNHTAAHESLTRRIGGQRLAYPPNHIEADNRLSWFLGRLDLEFGNDAFYVHLRRDRKRSADSFARREHFGIMKAYREGILLGEEENWPAPDLALDYLETVETNIQLFLKDKTRKIDFALERARTDFYRFWELIGAEGDLDRALREWEINYNASTTNSQQKSR
ncbi:MAG: hypothetical protein KJ558_12030 [Gammaproteobacteria bacterium]|nr:hypothetical protein [Gammaproteobacteria bacterium]MBU1655532.1 hypothetical protein [Gammaproteobacteria bacterium]MBU1961280.1 hypothetical protein [Gammaproteobacteria bacterium]